MTTRFLIFFSLFLLIIDISIIKYPHLVFSQNDITNNIINNNTWISKRDNLNITMKLAPEVPVIDQKTIISFDIRKLDGPAFPGDLNTRVTITDHDGRLYKFNNQIIPVTNGTFSVDYIFPDDGEHRIILQLYNNTSAFTISSFDIFIPHPLQPSPADDFFSSILKFFQNLKF
ncbi:MAG: hypothetical protein H0X03_02105 [Nitrosopumilus sp.]|nr:hypothetical protein [Nitrosopumilus sp.]